MVKWTYSNSFKNLTEAKDWQRKKEAEGYKRVKIDYIPGASMYGNDYVVMVDRDSNRGRKSKKPFGGLLQD